MQCYTKVGKVVKKNSHRNVFDIYICYSQIEKTLHFM